MTSSPTDTQNRIAFIDGLRGFAILGVIYHHLFTRFTGPGYGAIELGGFTLYPYTVLSNGWLGVNLFFFLSGFVLFAPYCSNNRSMSREGGIIDYYTRRSKRLLPLYYFNLFICAFIFFPTFGFGKPDFFTHFLFASTFTGAFTMDYFIPKFNWVLWSIYTEFWFSVLLPIVILAINRVGIYKVTIVVMIIALSVRIFGMDEQFAFPNNPYLNPVKDSIFGRLDDFVLGMLCCYVCINNQFSTVTVKSAPIFTFIGLLLGLIACQLWDGIATKNVNRDIAPYIHILTNASFFLIVLSFYRMSAFIRVIATNWPIRVTGMMCYSLYVWHGVLMIGMFAPIRYQFSVTSVAAYFFALLVICALSYRYIEFGYDRDTKKLFGISQKAS